MYSQFMMHGQKNMKFLNRDYYYYTCPLQTVCKFQILCKKRTLKALNVFKEN